MDALSNREGTPPADEEGDAVSAVRCDSYLAAEVLHV